MDRLQLWRKPPLLRSAGHFRSWNAPVAGLFKSKVRALNDCVQGVGSHEGDVGSLFEAHGPALPRVGSRRNVLNEGRVFPDRVCRPHLPPSFSFLVRCPSRAR